MLPLPDIPAEDVVYTQLAFHNNNDIATRWHSLAWWLMTLRMHLRQHQHAYLSLSPTMAHAFGPSAGIANEALEAQLVLECGVITMG